MHMKLIPGCDASYFLPENYGFLLKSVKVQSAGPLLDSHLSDVMHHIIDYCLPEDYHGFLLKSVKVQGLCWILIYLMSYSTANNSSCMGGA